MKVKLEKDDKIPVPKLHQPLRLQQVLSETDLFSPDGSFAFLEEQLKDDKKNQINILGLAPGCRLLTRRRC